MNPNDILTLLSTVLSLGLIIGGIFAWRAGMFTGTTEIQTRTIEALKTRVETLEGQVESDEKEITRLRQVLNTVRHALGRRGLHIQIDGDVVTLFDSAGQSDSTPIHPKIRKPPRPLNPISDDDEIDAS